MAKRKPLTKTQKERKSVKAAIRRYEKIGIRFSDKLKEEINKANYSKLHALHKYRFKKLLSTGTGISESGEIVSGFQKRSEVRRASARKAAETRKARSIPPYISDLPIYETPEYKPSDEALERERERQQKQTELENKEKDWLREGQIIYQNIENLIEKFASNGAGRTGEHLQRFFDNEINSFGFDIVMETIAMTPDEIYEAAQAVIFYAHDDEKLSRAVESLAHLIKGSFLELEEQRDLIATYEGETEY